METNIEQKSNYGGFTKIDAPVIHTMPRRFLNAKVDSGDSHKGMGLLILGLGAIALISGGFFVYYFVLNDNSLTPSLINQNNIQNESPVVNNSKTTTDVVDNQKDVEDKKVISIDEEEEDMENEEAEAEEEEEEGEERMQINIGASSTDTIMDVDDKSSSTSTIVEENKPVFIPKNKEKNVYLEAPDADKDGLSDREEVILGTKKDTQDSDQDTYIDSAELKNLYNPAGEGKLIVNQGIVKHVDAKNFYSLYIPQKWTVNDNVNGDTSVFKIDDTQFVQIIVLENEEKDALLDWYKKQFGVTSIKDDQKVYKKLWDGIKDESGLIYYLSPVKQDKIFIINYSVPEGGMLFYKALFQLMIDSIEI